MAKEQKLYTFRVIGGEHLGSKRTYKKGYTFQSRYPLDEMFVGKFDRVPDTPVILDDDTPDKRYIPQKKAEVQLPFDFDEAADVTHMFPAAKDADLAVYKNALGGYAVIDANAKIKVNLADEVLGSKKSVNSFISSLASPSKQD